MRAVVVAAPDDLQIINIGEPSASAAQALVRIHEVGICGTDLKILSGGVPVGYPRVLGHELVGEVVEPGERGLFTSGARVLIDPSVSCGHCRWCRNDDAHLCAEGGLMGRDIDGGLAEYVAVEERQLLALPDGIPWNHGPLLQILGTCVHGQTRISTSASDIALVVGLGVSGLLQLQLLRARGVGTVIGVTRSPEKLRLAQQLGATAVATPDQAATLVDEVTHGRGVDLVVESSGALAGLRTAVESTRVGGTVLLFGTLNATSGDFPYYLLYYKELRLISSRAARWRDYAAAIEHVANGRVDVAPLLTQQFSLDRASDAMDTFRDGQGVLKVTVRVPADGEIQQGDAP